MEPGSFYVLKVRDWNCVESLDMLVEAAAQQDIRLVLLPPEIDVVGKGSIPDIVSLLQEALKDSDRCEDCGRPDCQKCV